MNEAATYSKRLTARMAVLTLGQFLVLAALATPVLQLGDEALRVIVRILALGSGAAVLTAVLISRAIHRFRFVLRTLALGSGAMDGPDLDGLRRLGRRVVALQLAVALLGDVLLGSSLLRPEGVPAQVGYELAVLGAAGALATLVVARVISLRLTGELLEISPPDAIGELVTELSRLGQTQQSGRRTLALAVVLPVMLVGVGGVLASFAHLRAMTEESRTLTALTLARGVVGPGELKRSPGRLAAIAVARQWGYDITLTPERLDRSVKRGDRQVTHTAVLDHGSATVSFKVDMPLAVSAPLPALALLLLLGAWAGAYWLSGLVSRDLGASALRLRTLGTERVMQGGSAEHFVARFGVVASLESAALSLAERFREFANAQERALAAKEAALRARGLFFASISHDLKTPLNAIIGFADAIDERSLSEAQRESLGLIATRGREVVALIETILDAARVEAGELRLTRTPITAVELVNQTSTLARRLCGEDARLQAEASDDVPAIPADPAHLPRALAVILANALRARTLEGEPVPVRLGATFDRASRTVRLAMVQRGSSLTRRELEDLFARQARARAKGLVLGLGLARSIIELHGGRIELAEAADRLELTVVLPAWTRGKLETLPPRP